VFTFCQGKQNSLSLKMHPIMKPTTTTTTEKKILSTRMVEGKAYMSHGKKKSN